MKKYVYFIAIFTITALFLSTGAFAQNGKRAKKAEMRAKSKEMSRFTVKTKFGRSKQYASFGTFLGMSNYFGDLAPRNGRGSTSLKLSRTYFGAFYQKRVNANIALRGHLAWARLRGDDFNAPFDKGNVEKARYVRNLSFRNDVIELGLSGTIDILPTDRGYLRRNFLNGYGLLGIMGFYHNPKGKVPTGYNLPQAGNWIALQPLGTEGQGLKGYAKKYFRIQPAVMIGGGVRYRIADKLDLGLEIAWRFTFTDYIDDVSTSYAKDEDVRDGVKDRLWYAMSNKSGQPLSSTGKKRKTEFYQPENFPGKPSDNGGDFGGLVRADGYGVFEGTDSQGLPLLSVGSPRGNTDKDGYTVTTLSATYIMEFRAKTPKFR